MEQALGIATLVVVCVGFAVVIPLLVIVFLRRNGNGESAKRVAADDARRIRDDEERAKDNLRRDEFEERLERKHDDEDGHKTLPFKG